MSYARPEIAGHMKKLFAPQIAMGGCVKDAIRKAARVLNCSFNRARDLMRQKAKPTVEEMDTIRSLAGVTTRNGGINAQELQKSLDALEAQIASVRASLVSEQSPAVRKLAHEERSAIERVMAR